MSQHPVSRRTLLAFAAAAVAPALPGCTGAPTARPAPPPAPSPAPAAADRPQPTTRRERVRSEHRGTDVELAITYPAGAPAPESLPLVLYLHGRDGPRPSAMPGDTLAALEAEHRAGSIPAFGFVSVDGGYNAYWFDGSANGDLASMLLDELPTWLRERGFTDRGGQPFAVGGISSGGFGALHYAVERSRRGDPLDGIGVLSPALTTNWPHAAERGAFADEQQWHEVNPLDHLGELGEVPLGVWIGDADPFYPGAEQLAANYGNTRVFSVLPGGHEVTVFDAVGAEMVHHFADVLPEHA
ncbi:alpha/beta hydrolase [Saccharopolyspora griseoalba]|uniref:Acyl-CoA:diacylglycerol acyltransferase n=1 Tax=Saccharopolyspora griseoalba TaxID=1431848 RepID=A0ABW2LQF4_9PSEU